MSRACCLSFRASIPQCSPIEGGCHARKPRFRNPRSIHLVVRGLRSICDWARLKFQIKLAVEDLTGKSDDEIKELLHGKVMELYRQREMEFPVKVAMARFMADRHQVPSGQRYDREGLFHWTRHRFPEASGWLRSA